MDKQKRQEARAQALRDNLKRRKASSPEKEPADAAPPPYLPLPGKEAG